MSAMTAIEHIEVTTSGVTSVVLNDSGAWSGYTDLKLLISARITATGGTYSVAYHHINNAALNSGRQLYGTGSSVQAHGVHYLYTVNNSSTADTFCNGEIYYSNFGSSNNPKLISSDWVNENNATATIHWIGAQAYASTSPITRIDYVQLVGDIAVGSTFTLYGITAGSDGTTTVS